MADEPKLTLATLRSMAEDVYKRQDLRRALSSLAISAARAAIAAGVSGGPGKRVRAMPNQMIAMTPSRPMK